MELTQSLNKRKSLEDVIIARCASICRRAARVMSNIIETRQRKLKGENCTNLRPHHQNLTTDETTLEAQDIDKRNKKMLELDFPGIKLVTGSFRNCSSVLIET